MRKIESCLNALQVGLYREELVLETLFILDSYSITQLSQNRILVARTFYRLLCYCQVLYGDMLPVEIENKIFHVFESVRRICVDATDDEKKDSSMIIVHFLNKLEAQKDNMQYLDDSFLRDSIEILLEQLDEIHFLLDIKQNDELVFPINKMIEIVVAKPEFISADRPLSLYHIHVLQLAVKLFKNNEDEKKILNELHDKCNLKFLDYLKNPRNLIDTKDLLNNRLNGVMIFYDADRLKVLIRHENKNYFLNKPEWMSQEYTIESEWDYEQINEIGAFIEYELEIGDSLIDYSQMLLTENGRVKFLKMMYEKNVFNVLLEKSIIEKTDGSYVPLNPYCYQDKKIVKGRLCRKDGKDFDLSQIKIALNEYRNVSLNTSSQSIINRLSFGLTLELLQKENVGLEALGINNYMEDDWYQNQMIKNWVLSSSDRHKSLEYVLEIWKRELEYCNKLVGSNRGVNITCVETHEVISQDFYPLNCDITWIYQLLECSQRDQWYVFEGESFVKDDEHYLNVKLFNDFMGERYCKNFNQNTLIVPVKILKNEDDIYDEQWGVGQRYFFLYNPIMMEGKFYNQNILKQLSALEDIQSKNHITFRLGENISKENYNKVASLMELHKSALEEGAKKAFPLNDFDAQVYYRLLHNMLWSKISEENVGDYFRIFSYHQMLSFTEINENNCFTRTDVNCLYVPKDAMKSDSVLRSVYDNYLRPQASRDVHSLFDGELSKTNAEYYVNGNRINRIMFLCDNFEGGKATRRMLTAYLDLKEHEFSEEEVEREKQRIQKYYVEEGSNYQDVNLKDVVLSNSCQIGVYSYYGTEVGKCNIDDILERNNKDFYATDYEIEIVNKASQIQCEVNRVWPSQNCGNFYAVVREFNMTKANVFPNEMLIDTTKAICLFVKKEEKL